MAKQLNKAAFNQWVYDIIDDYSRRIEVYYGGAGSGKSYGACQKALLKALNRKRKILIIRKVGATLKHSIFQLVIDLLADSGFLPAARVNRSDFQIDLANGSQLIFKGLDDPEKIKSIAGITDIVIEEATELTEEDFLQLNLRLRPVEADPQIYLMFNPVSKANWVYGYFFINPPNNARIIHTTYKDNRFLTEDYKRQLQELEQRNPAYYRIYALGEFATLDKLVYPVWKKQLVSQQEIQTLPMFVGLDFGYTNDPSAIVWGRCDTDKKRIYITGEYAKTGMMNDEIGRTIISLGLSKERIFADSAEPKSIDELRRIHGITRIHPAAKGRDSILNGIQFITQHELIVDERCTKTIEELENYTWKKDKKTGEYINEPIDSFNHCLAGDTMVDTMQKKVPIRDLVGTKGLAHCFDETTGLPTVSLFNNVRMTRKDAVIYQVELQDGRCVCVTPDHLFLTVNGWKRAMDLSAEDFLIDIGGSLCK